MKGTVLKRFATITTYNGQLILSIQYEHQATQPTVHVQTL